MPRRPLVRMLLAAAVLSWLALGGCAANPGPPDAGAADGGRPDAGAQPDAGPSPQAWLRDHATSLDTDDPLAADGDLAPLGALVGDAGLVGLGEATHGTHQLFRMKHRLFRWLVEHRGFTALGFEAGFELSRAIDQAIQTDAGALEPLVWKLDYFEWSTEEVVALLEWMRAYNLSHPTRLRFVGFDLQDGNPEMDAVLAYLHRLDPTLEAQAQALYLPFRPYALEGNPAVRSYLGADAGERATCRANLQAVVDLLVSRAADLGADGGEAAYRLALQEARVVVQDEAFQQQYQVDRSADPGASFDARDQGMAENAAWWREQLGPGTRLALWAHQGHLGKEDAPARVVMGAALARRFGADYRALTATAQRGSVRALLVELDGGVGLGSTPIPAPPRDTLADWLVAAGFERGLLDLGTLGTDAPSQLTGALPALAVGGVVFRAAGPGSFWAPLDLPRLFDGLVMVRDGTPSVPFPEPTSGP